MRTSTGPLSQLTATAALVAAVLVADVASATLITRDLNVTVSNEQYTFDLNEDGVDDFRVTDRGDEPSEITGISPGANILIFPFLPFYPDLYFPGDVIDVPAERFDPNSFDVFAQKTGVLSGVPFAPFNFVGANAFIGVTVRPEGGGEETTTLGFLEITRGSTIIGRVGYSTVPGPIVVIPEPTAAFFAVVGLGVVACRRRR